MNDFNSVCDRVLTVFYELFFERLYWYEFLACLAEAAVTAWFCCRYLGFKDNKLKPLKYIAFFALLSANNYIFTVFLQYQRIPLNFNLIICLFFCVRFLKGKIPEKLFTAIIPTFAYIIVNRICAKFFSLLMDKSEDSKYVLLFSILGFILICELVLRLRKKSFSLTTPQWILQLSCFGISLTIVSILRTITYYNSADDERFLAIFILIAVLNVLLYVIMLIMQKAAEDRAEKTALQAELANRKNLISESDIRYKEMRILRHDMKHYVTTAIELLDEDQPQKAREFLEEILAEKLNPAQSGVNTGNSVIDATLTEKQKLCALKNIELKMELDSEIGDISAIDLGVMLANLFDNAVTACEKTQKPQIYLSLKRVKGYLKLEIKNTIEESVLQNNPELATTNSDIENHGLGISSIRSLAEKYDGSVTFSEEENFFLAVVILKLEYQPR